MAGKNTAVFGIFDTRAHAERAVDQLNRAGFSTQNISVLMSDKDSSHEFATEKNTKAPEAAAAGAGVGGGVGGAVGLLAGLGRFGDPWSRSVDCGWPNYGRTRGTRSRRRGGRACRRACRNGNSGVRGEAVRRQGEGWRSASVSSLRQFGASKYGERRSEGCGR